MRSSFKLMPIFYVEPHFIPTISDNVSVAPLHETLAEFNLLINYVRSFKRFSYQGRELKKYLTSIVLSLESSYIKSLPGTNSFKFSSRYIFFI